MGIHYGGVGRWRQTSKKEEGKHKITNKQTHKYQLQTVLVTVRRKYRYCEKEKQVEHALVSKLSERFSAKALRMGRICTLRGGEAGILR